MSTSAYCSRRGSKVAEGLKREGRYYGNELIPMLDRTHASPKATEKTQQAEVLLPKYTTIAVWRLAQHGCVELNVPIRRTVSGRGHIKAVHGAFGGLETGLQICPSTAAHALQDP